VPERPEGLFNPSPEQFRALLGAERRARLAAEKERDEAEHRFQEQAAYFAAMSHELRTPLNAIIGFSEILKSEMFGPLGSERYREYCKFINESGDFLLSLVNEVLDISKLDAGKLDLHLAPVDLCRLIVACAKCVEPQAAKSRVGICIDFHCGPCWLEADEKRLHQLLLNLVSNAVKFTPEGGEVRISVYRRGGRIVVAVSDTGIGMSAGDIPKALSRFGQIDSEQGRKHEGTGLGLPLAKQLTELHGGQFAIESEPDVGTTVTLTFPPERTLSFEAASEAAPSSAEAHRQKRGEQARVLVNT
jgi:signal transduction histidine kinase